MLPKSAAICLLFAIPILALSRSPKEGIYSKPQAERGEVLYNERCAACHGSDLKGTETAPELSGKEFLGRWSGNTVGGLFHTIYKSMPTDDPGKLSTQQGADLVAFILSRNGFPAGAKDLADAEASLADIRFDAAR